MVLVAIGLATLVAFAALSETARSGTRWARAGALVVAGTLLPLAGLGITLSLVLLSLRCDESCDENLSPTVRSGQWWHSLDAWQWWGQFLVAGLGFLAIGAALASLARRGYRRATGFMILAAACFGAWTAFLAPLGDRFGI